MLLGHDVGRICFAGAMAEFDARPDLRDANPAL
jgi:hypothetical protein